MPTLDSLSRNKSTPYGGLLLLEALCRRWHLWDRIDEAQFPAVDVVELGARPSQSIVAQLVFAMATGGATCAEAAMLREDSLLLRLVGPKQPADENTLLSWLDTQTDESVQSLRRLNVALVTSALAECCPAEAEAGKNPLQVVMHTKNWMISRETRFIVDGGPSWFRRCWKTLTVGPFLMDGLWNDDASQADNHAQFEQLVMSHLNAWNRYDSYFVSDQFPGCDAWNRVVDAAGFAQWSAELASAVVCNEIPINLDSQGLKWKPANADDSQAQQLCMFYPKCPDPEKGERPVVPGSVALGRRKGEGDGSYWHQFLAVPGGTTSAQEYFTRHYAAIPVAVQILDDLNLNRMVTLGARARTAFFIIASLTYNLLMALRLLLLPHLRRWGAREMIRGIITTPAVMSSSGRRNTLCMGTTKDWPPGWRDFVDRSMPRKIRRLAKQGESPA